MVAQWHQQSSSPSVSNIHRERKKSRTQSSDCDYFLKALHETTLQLMDRTSIMDTNNNNNEYVEDTDILRDTSLLDAFRSNDIENADDDDDYKLPIDLASYFGEGSFQEHCIVDLDDYSMDTRKHVFDDSNSYSTENNTTTSFCSSKRLDEVVANDNHETIDELEIREQLSEGKERNAIAHSSKSNGTKGTDSLTEVDWVPTGGIPVNIYLMKNRLDRHEQFYSKALNRIVHLNEETLQNQNNNKVVVDIYSRQKIKLGNLGDDLKENVDVENGPNGFVRKLFHTTLFKKRSKSCAEEKTLLQI